ncbi:ATP-binding cassette domain-containing protein [Heliobacillus mobilis]|uniref:ATP-binding cassette domain-containing protein n=1 Tax=Heliobacterium mobile TaxID=28064 RepID=A0A6I3SHE8_HELMO|nr:ABC transporter ATP-binding protein [Heliobacterium mobile]MTV48258.1 ATP-binding cassette domain-containing protein [Heliobacterium mobile]
MMIEAIDVTKRYGNETILSSISFEIKKGQSVAVLGPSGSGKTTLLSILGLLLEPCCGEILLYGQRMRGLSDTELSNLRNHHMGYVFQNSQLIGSLTVGDNVLLPARLAGKAREKQKQSREILEQFGLANRINHLPHQLSFGQKRRVALARALVMEPQLILADEPTNDLDEKMAQQVSHVLLGLKDQGVALIVATHDRQLAERMDRRVRIDQGKLFDITFQDREIGKLKDG